MSAMNTSTITTKLASKIRRSTAKSSGKFSPAREKSRNGKALISFVSLVVTLSCDLHFYSQCSRARIKLVLCRYNLRVRLSQRAAIGSRWKNAAQLHDSAFHSKHYRSRSKPRSLLTHKRGGLSYNALRNPRHCITSIPLDDCNDL